MNVERSEPGKLCVSRTQGQKTINFGNTVETGEPLHVDPQLTQMTEMGLRPRPARQARPSASMQSSVASCALHDPKVVGGSRVGLSDSTLYFTVRPRPKLSPL